MLIEAVLLKATDRPIASNDCGPPVLAPLLFGAALAAHGFLLRDEERPILALTFIRSSLPASLLNTLQISYLLRGD